MLAPLENQHTHLDGVTQLRVDPLMGVPLRRVQDERLQAIALGADLQTALEIQLVIQEDGLIFLVSELLGGGRHSCAP